jgi:hypothetical protein
VADAAALIERYASGAAAVLAAVDDVGSARLDVADAGGWTARQVVHHLADAETRSAVRLRQLLAEEAPQIQAYDESGYAERLHYDRPIETSLAVVRAVRAASLELLGRLSPADFERSGHHPEHGAYSVLTWLQIYADHAHEHAAQMRSSAGV